MSEPTRAELLSKIREVIHRAGHLVDDSEEVGPDETEPQEVLAMHLRDLQRAVLALIGDDELHDAIDAVMNALGSEWKPIDDEARNGTTVLLWSEYMDEPCTGAWGRLSHGRMGWAARHEGSSVVESEHDVGGTTYKEISVATHYMPLPAPPSSGASDG